MKRNRLYYCLIGYTLLVAMMAGRAVAQNDAPAEWKKLVAAAREEGVVVISGPPGAQQRQAITTGWAKAFPDIQLDYTAARGSQIVSRVVRERTAGVFNWDVIATSSVYPTRQ